MIIASFDPPPLDGKAIHQIIDEVLCVVIGTGCQVSVFGRCQNTAVAEDFLHLQQINTGFDQMGGIAVAQIVE